MSNQRPDTLIGDELVQLLGRHGQASQVLVQVHEGRVSVSGDVHSAEVKADVLRQVAAVAGVLQVDDRLNVDHGHSSLGAPGQAMRDNPDGHNDAQMGQVELDTDSRHKPGSNTRSR
jgi:osmotically-inducible protein OsmY